MSTPIDERIGIIEEYRGHRLSDGDEQAAHLVDQRRDQDVATAYIEGTELVALCGHRWVPSRDPHNFPLCRACVAVLTGGTFR